MYIIPGSEKRFSIAGEIRKRLLYSLLFATVISLGISWGIYESTEGLEARQGTLLLVLVCFFLCIINFILSLTAYLNLNNKIRENIFYSGVAFLGLPTALLFWLTYQYSTSKSEWDTFESFIMLAGPSMFYISALIFNSYQFRETIKANEELSKPKL